MNYIDKLNATSVLIFAGENLINKYKKLNTYSVRVEKEKECWIVEHRFFDELNKLRKEDFVFTNYYIHYSCSYPCEQVPTFEFLSEVQGKYRALMCELNGKDYADKLAKEEAEAEEIMAMFSLKYKKCDNSNSQNTNNLTLSTSEPKEIDTYKTKDDFCQGR